jgi:hypothetical protein
MLDNPLIATNRPDRVLLFSSQQHLVPKFSVNGNVAGEYIDTNSKLQRFENDISHSEPYFRLGATTPYLGSGSFLVDQESQLRMATPTIRKGAEEKTGV